MACSFIKNGKVFLLSEYALDNQKYNSEYVDIFWENCTLRNWLNTNFLRTAFNTKKEREIIKTTHLKNYDNAEYKVPSGKDTYDKIYLLSLNDTLSKKYGFSSEAYENDINRRCSVTDYCKAMGVYVTFDNSDYYKKIWQTAEGAWTSWWWLRSPGIDNNHASYVYITGNVNSFGYVTNDTFSAVRPALQLELFK